VSSGELGAGWAAEDGVALVFEGQELREAVSSRPEACAYRVGRSGARLTEASLAARYLG
jgi:dipeptidase E